jgi:hypothetical protein
MVKTVGGFWNYSTEKDVTVGRFELDDIGWFNVLVDCWGVGAGDLILDIATHVA